MEFIFGYVCGVVFTLLFVLGYLKLFKPKTRYTGTLQVMQLRDKTRYSLDLDEDLEVLKNAKEVTFKVNNKSFPSHRS